MAFLHRILALLLGFNAVILLVPASGWAQQPDSLTVQLPEVDIQAARRTLTTADAPFAVSRRSRSSAVVALQPTLTLDAALSDLPGLQIDSRGHFALGERLSVRGIGRRAPFGTRGVQVVLDGIPLTLPDGQAMLEVIEPALLRTVELIRGPASLFWGNGSGGVLALSTDPERPSSFTRIRALGGSFGRGQGLAEAFLPIGAHDVHAYASAVRQKGYRAHSEGYRVRGGMNSRLNVGEDTKLHINGHLVHQDTEHPGSLTRAQVDADPRQARPLFAEDQAGKRSTQGQLGLTLRHATTNGQLSATAYGLLRELENPLPFAFIDLYRQAAGTRLTYRHQRGALRWNLGADAALQRDDRKNWNTVQGEAGDERLLDQLETVASGAIFGTARLALTDRLAATAGLRADVTRFSMDDQLLESDEPTTRGDQSGTRRFQNVSPAAGLSYRLESALLYANYRTAFETPTTTELVNRPNRLTGGFNPMLSPQQFRTVELGVRGQWPALRLRYDLALYRMGAEDQLTSEVDSLEREYFRNGGSATHTGIEGSATWRPLSSLTFRLSYTGGRYVFDRDTLARQHVPGLPAHHLFARLTIQQHGLWGRLAVETASSSYVNDANTMRADGYAVVDLHTGTRPLHVGGFRLRPFLTVQNVLDAQYAGSITVNAFGGRYFEPAPGRAVQAGMNVTF